jgi:hypothetical protein
MRNLILLGAIALFAVLTPAAQAQAGSDVGLLVRGLWLVQRFGTADAADPEKDQGTKARLAKALGKEASSRHRG